MPPTKISDILDSLLPGVSKARKLPRWPADVFCICASVLHTSGAYTTVVDDNPPHLRATDSAGRAALMRDVGARWRSCALGSAKLPIEIERWWATLMKQLNRPLARIATSPTCCAALLNLMTAADEAFAGVGILWPVIKGKVIESDAFLQEAEERLLKSMPEGSTLCRQVHASKARVLPKMHTAQNGLTIRSLSHFLAYCPQTNVRPAWLSWGVDTQRHALNLLIVPWPSDIRPNRFRESKRVNMTDAVARGGYGLFTFDAENGPAARYVTQLIEIAERDVGRIDGLVFPELSMSMAEFNRLAKSVMTRVAFIAAGTGKGSIGERTCGRNELVMNVKMPESSFVAQFIQKKHHRWKLTKSQILQYGIGANLHPEANWWEHISLRDRELNFVTLRPWLTLCLLVCEDLARPDPVADLVRSVGPNLIICLLMDGPQLSGRWPGRYAGVLSDDPGSSVLTLTSLGMSKLSRPNGSQNRSNVVALWRDALFGTKELEIPTGADALVLNLSVEYKEEWTADGRGDGGVTGFPVLVGSHPIYLGANRIRRK